MSLATRANGRGLPAVVEHEHPGPAEVVVRYTIHDLQEIAKTAANSGMFPMNAAQIMTLMLICEAEGLHPMQAMKRYHVIQNRPAMRADAILGEMMRHGWSVEWIAESDDRQRQEAFFQHPRKCPNGKGIRWTIEDAKAAGLANRDNWRNFPSAMLRSRVISTACRMLDPGIIAGIYSEEEVRDMQAAPAQPHAPRNPVRDAIDAARSTAPAAPTPGPEPARTGFGQWLDAFLADAYGRWAEVARDNDADPGKPMTRFQVANHVINAWIEEGTMAPEDVQDAKGRRDRNKVALAISTAWDDDPDDLRSLIEGYVRSDISRRCESAGIAPAGDGPADAPEPSDADESQGLADEDPAE